MKFITSIFITALLSFAACLFLPWWTIAIAAFMVSFFIPQPPLRSFLSGFTALFLLWALLSFVLSYNNEHLLAHKVSVVIIKTDSPFLLILATALIGGIVAGLASLTAAFARKPR